MGTRTQYPSTNRSGATVSPPRHKSAYPSRIASAAAPHQTRGARDGVELSGTVEEFDFAIAYEIVIDASYSLAERASENDYFYAKNAFEGLLDGIAPVRLATREPGTPWCPSLIDQDDELFAPFAPRVELVHRGATGPSVAGLGPPAS